MNDNQLNTPAEPGKPRKISASMVFGLVAAVVAMGLIGFAISYYRMPQKAYYYIDDKQNDNERRALIETLKNQLAYARSQAQAEPDVAPRIIDQLRIVLAIEQFILDNDRYPRDRAEIVATTDLQKQKLDVLKDFVVGSERRFWFVFSKKEDLYIRGN